MLQLCTGEKFFKIGLVVPEITSYRQTHKPSNFTVLKYYYIILNKELFSIRFNLITIYVVTVHTLRRSCKGRTIRTLCDVSRYLIVVTHNNKLPKYVLKYRYILFLWILLKKSTTDFFLPITLLQQCFVTIPFIYIYIRFIININIKLKRYPVA